MTREEAIENLKWLLECSYVDSFEDEENEALEMAIKALEQNESAEEWYKLFVEKLEQEPCSDSVSMEAVIEWLKDKDIIKLKSQEENARKELQQLYSVNPQQKTGHWIPSHITESILDECSECGFSCGAFTFNY